MGWRLFGGREEGGGCESEGGVEFGVADGEVDWARGRYRDVLRFTAS